MNWGTETTVMAMMERGHRDRSLQQSKNPLFAVMGWTGVFFVIEFAIEGFSIDSFALPYIWFAAGLLTAAVHLYLNSGESASQRISEAGESQLTLSN